MKSILPWILLAVFAVEALVALRPKTESGFHTREFGKLPVLLNGRVPARWIRSPAIRCSRFAARKPCPWRRRKPGSSGNIRKN